MGEVGYLDTLLERDRKKLNERSSDRDCRWVTPERRCFAGRSVSVPVAGSHYRHGSVCSYIRSTFS